MHLTIRNDIWHLVGQDKLVSDGRVYQPGRARLYGISLAGWLSHFCHAHHDCRIDWPDSAWSARYESDLLSVQVHIGSWPWGRIVARAAREGVSAAYVLRRLLSQHFGLRPEHPCRVTGGPHVRTQGELRRCPTCSELEPPTQTLQPWTPTATRVPYPWEGSTRK